MHRPVLEVSRDPGRRDQLQNSGRGWGVGVRPSRWNCVPAHPFDTFIYCLFLEGRECFGVSCACVYLGVCEDACSLFIFCLVVSFSLRFWRAYFPLAVYISVYQSLSVSPFLSLISYPFPYSHIPFSLLPFFSHFPSAPSSGSPLSPIPHPPFLAKAYRQVVYLASQTFPLCCSLWQVCTHPSLPLLLFPLIYGSCELVITR